jgi:hypothetical protein
LSPVDSLLQGMGQASVSCHGGCGCKTFDIDAHNKLEKVILKAFNVDAHNKP